MNKFTMKKNQTGISLVELMVSLTIGLFLLAGLIQMFVTTKKSYNVQDSLSRIEENSRFALDTLSRTIRLAGYKTDPWQDNSSAFPVVTLFPGSGQYISGTEGGVTDSDSINIRYQGSVNSAGVADNRVFDCAGTSIGNTTVELSFSISGSDLVCSINGATPVVMVDNVAHMQILYGIDAGGDGAANQYVVASSVTNWVNVVSAKIGLVFSSEDIEGKRNLASQTLSFPDLSANPMNAMFDQDNDGHPDLFKSYGSSDFDTQTAPDKRLYKVYTATITIRNSVL
ncbi:MAG: PilW family protein [Methylococcaceae bacterium]